jgi:hypothetical protein
MKAMFVNPIYTTYPDKVEDNEVAFVWSNHLKTAKIIVLPGGEVTIAFGWYGLLSIPAAIALVPDIANEAKEALTRAYNATFGGADIEEWGPMIYEVQELQELARALSMAIKVAQAYPEKADVLISYN